ncbi:selenium metabolism membrane protein YedE/FdhT [Anaeromyxobacter diazotrophicus]|uniref:Sulphur transport domain-containing protein n=1 Tax=Anaeromyxobacter diazotrophicus TaxID=2590199 RepID=A0A7I9VR08_9BACT|nr:selenium metabolism membrane protein YedE/FdhT [Anaeromyxobacter diazotrophicus]GEJ58853.1 hypothetical protein AMYX_35940 [Anaeromyxobacter diazotrophicus]
MHAPSFREKYLVRFWSPTPAVAVAGVLSAYYFGVTGTFWAVTGEFTRWGGHLMQLAGAHPERWGYFRAIGLQGLPWDRVDGWVVLGMFAGALAAALWANNVKLRAPRHGVRWVQGFLGGFVAGFGARLAMGCNLAAFFTGIPQFSLHAWMFTVATAAGSWAGVRVALHPVFRAPVRVEKVTAAAQVRAPAAGRRFWLGALLFAAFAGVALVVATRQLKLGLAGLFGLAFGLLIERAQICFTAAFRDLWITGRTLMAKAILAGMAASAVGTFSYVLLGVAPKIFWAGPNALVGGFLFGLGIVVAGGCETGWMYRAVEGQVHFWVVGVGNIAGATVLAWLWDRVAPALALAYPKVNLLQALGPVGGLAITYAGLLTSFLLLVWWERRFLTRAGGERARSTSPAAATGVLG